MDHKSWVDKESMANGVAFKSLSHQCRITYDNAIEDAFLVCTDDRIVKFTRTREGLYGYKFSKECLDMIEKLNDRTT